MPMVPIVVDLPITTGRVSSQKKELMHETGKKKFTENEAKSNHAVVAMEYADCPIQKTCFGIATGFGGAPTALCEHLNFIEGECTYEAPHN